MNVNGIIQEGFKHNIQLHQSLKYVPSDHFEKII